MYTNQSHLDNHVAFVVSSIPIIFYMREYEKDKRMGEKMQKECSSLCFNSKNHFVMVLENKDMNIRSHIKSSKQFFYLHIIKVFIFIDDLIPREGSQYILFNHTISIPLAKSQQKTEK